jgi:hypothetical protein
MDKQLGTAEVHRTCAKTFILCARVQGTWAVTEEPWQRTNLSICKQRKQAVHTGSIPSLAVLGQNGSTAVAQLPDHH